MNDISIHVDCVGIHTADTVPAFVKKTATGRCLTSYITARYHPIDKHLYIFSVLTNFIILMTTKLTNEKNVSNLVPESDLEVAIRAIRWTLQGSNDDDEKKNNAIAQLCGKKYEEILRNSVQAISDEAYHEYISNFIDDKPTKPPTTPEPIDPRQFREGEQEEDDWEESDLIDPQAVSQVQELRAQIRTVAKRIVQSRQAVLDSAVQLAQRQVRIGSKYLADHSEQTVDSYSSSADLSEKQLQQKMAHAKLMEDVKMALEQVQQSLSSIEAELPAQLEDLRSTVSEIDANLPGADGKPLSQIERAIQYRHPNHTHEESNQQNSNDTGDITMEIQQLPPEQQLAYLLCQ
jgi:hypothetical protein